MEKEILAKLINMIGNINGEIVFTPVFKKTKGAMLVEKVEYTPKAMETLLHMAHKQEIEVKFAPLKYNNGIIKGDHSTVNIGIRMDMDFNEYVYTLAHELAHYFLHYDKGDTIISEKHSEYEEQAERAAKMLLAAFTI